MTRQAIFAAVKAARGNKPFTAPEVAALDAALDALGVPGEGAAAFDRQAFLARYVSKSAPAITDADIQAAAQRLGVSPKHVEMIRAVESNGRSFDDKGRPVILFEPHVFHRRTNGSAGTTGFSYPKWGAKPYPGSFDGRWTQMADAAAHDEQAALESASWGLFQIMGFHWQALGYDSVQDFAARMAKSEAEHLEAVVRFIEKNGLAPALRRCKAGVPDSCREFAKGYNGGGYEKNRYHEKMAKALAR